MRQSGVMGIALMLALSISCGKSEEQKAAERAAEETKKAAEALATAAQKTAEVATKEGLSAAAKALEGFAGAMAGTARTSGQLSGIAIDVSRRSGLAASRTDRRTHDDSDIVLTSRGRLHERQVAGRDEDCGLGVQPDAHRAVVDVPHFRLREANVLRT